MIMDTKMVMMKKIQCNKDPKNSRTLKYKTFLIKH